MPAGSFDPVGFLSLKRVLGGGEPKFGIGFRRKAETDGAGAGGDERCAEANAAVGSAIGRGSESLDDTSEGRFSLEFGGEAEVVERASGNVVPALIKSTGMRKRFL